jgi:hypothetical protein
MKNKYIYIFIIIIFLIFIIKQKIEENKQKIEENKQKIEENKRKIENLPNLSNRFKIENKESIHILITRYKETDMSIVLKPFINKKNTTIFIYNKGDDIPFTISNNIKNINIIKIPNLGWDAYGFLYHIINNYNNLPNYIYTFHASVQYLNHKYNLFKDILDKQHDDKYFYGGNLLLSEMTFSLDNWNASTEINKLSNNESEKYSISSIRPLNKWLLNKINKIPDFAIDDKNKLKCNFFGMFFVHKSRILKYPITFYINLFNEISVWQSEVNHYLERSWYLLYGE